ncbi:acyl-CoA thioesterase [Cordyceps militaris CM01]|uniref:Acyl-CoA thioesterase n=1 Tax=Cordyceps militaris (strain CM01) TaxID=983644 RepID=G3J837_CORMM|nr:acyl-CoA thioesterase [Cordyceps militaris CM01]EGX93879.1 acyl-CoA thioesterase [Cordyceps militaris CM01]
MTGPQGQLGFEAFELSRVPGSTVQYTSRYPAWRPGADLPDGVEEQPTKTKTKKSTTTGVFGCRLEDKQSQAAKKGYMGIHSIQGVFTVAGHSDRPFVHEVTPIHTGKSFATRLVQTRQPKEPSIPDPATGTFDPSDGTKALNGVCFTCLTTFKRSMASPDDVQETEPPQVRFASILAQRRPDAWDRPRIVHIDSVQDQVERSGQAGRPGTFPVLEMYRVDMAAYNADRPVPERRELLLYRPCAPIPRDDPNGHVVCHAFEADRNGLTMLGGHLGYGRRWGRAASLSYAFYVHVNAEEAVMDGAGWWVQEAAWPRVAAGRCTMVSKIWSPEGRHVASGYQDGMVVPEDPSKL